MSLGGTKVAASRRPNRWICSVLPLPDEKLPQRWLAPSWWLLLWPALGPPPRWQPAPQLLAGRGQPVVLEGLHLWQLRLHFWQPWQPWQPG